MRLLTLTLLVGLSLAASSSNATAAGSDECIGAAAVTGVSFDEAFDSSTATTGLLDPFQSCTVGGPDRNAHSVWYRYVAPASGMLSIVAAAAPFPGDPPTIITVYRGGCALLQEIACADNPTRGDSALVTRVVAENSYWIEIANEAGASGGRVTIHLSLAPDSPICPSAGGSFLKGTMNMVGLGPPAGNEHLKLTARVLLPEPLPQDTITGLQVLVTGFVPEYTPIIEWSARTLAVPPGGPGSGCDPRDGWTSSRNGASRRYRNLSNAFPPSCLRGSAQGLKEIRLLRKSPDWRVVDVKVRAKNTTIEGLPNLDATGGRDTQLWLSTTLGSTLGPENGDACANTQRPLTCVYNGKETAVTCKLR